MTVDSPIGVQAAGSAVSGEDAVVGDLYQTAALIVGDGEEAVTAFEKALATGNADPCMEPAAAYEETRELLIALSVQRVVELHPEAFLTEKLGPGPDVCFDTDDVSASGLSADELAGLLAGPGRTRLRDWLEHLEPASRVVFVLRAILGKDGVTVSRILCDASGQSAWTADQVGQVFRGALCSLANSLVHTRAA